MGRIIHQKSAITSALVDHILRVGAYSTAVGAGLLMPNIVQSLDKPLKALDKRLSERAREREIMRVVYYMKSRGYLAGEYEHGLQVTSAGRERLIRVEIKDTKITAPKKWDGVWRIIFYDIPESHRAGRQALVGTLRNIGCFQLQKSVWITPFACREVVERVAAYHDVDTYITYLEASYLDNAEPLIGRFAKKYSQTTFR